MRQPSFVNFIKIIIACGILLATLSLSSCDMADAASALLGFSSDTTEIGRVKVKRDESGKITNVQVISGKFQVLPDGPTFTEGQSFSVDASGNVTQDVPFPAEGLTETIIVADTDGQTMNMFNLLNSLNTGFNVGNTFGATTGGAGGNPTLTFICP